MHALYELKDMLCKELEEYGKKGELTAGSLDVIDKLAHATKNLDKIIKEHEEEEYSNRGMNDVSYRGASYARGRGSNVRRDSRGRYSREGYSRAENMVDELHDLMEDAPNEHIKQEMRRLITKVEEMM